ncbi:hypothetical protein [Mangrovicella endophytica]|uniref:hypothetical protein n=1 Tax=Mangrovicella endophytica TaxID=2066697 RepID=UPI000C9DCD93|nr:hypothetical protein [Mangrovicella endophytica]
MEDTKSWYQSKTIWGSLVSLGVALASFFGVDIEGSTSDALILALGNAATAVGAVVAIIGRIRAEKSIR